MSITDELRGWANGFAMTRKHYELQLLAIADRIDAEHEAELNDASETRNSDENLESDGWARLPVDADGEYIHIGDVMESRTGFDLFPQFEVRAMRYDGDEWGVFDRLGDRYEPSGLRHYHAPTVEDVMVEFATDWESAQDGEEKSVVIAEYAAKLRLAGEDE